MSRRQFSILIAISELFFTSFSGFGTVFRFRFQFSKLFYAISVLFSISFPVFKLFSSPFFSVFITVVLLSHVPRIWFLTCVFHYAKLNSGLSAMAAIAGLLRADDWYGLTSPRLRAAI